MPRHTRPLLLLSLLLATLAGFDLSGLQKSWAIPAFGRKYNFECKDCHVGASPKLNEFGQVFRDQGYQLPPRHGLPNTASSQEPAPPQTLFERHCMTCHGVQGRGDGPMGEALMPPPPDLTDQTTRDKSDAELLQILRDGSSSTAMPPFKYRLTEQQLRDLVAYIRSLNE